MRVNFVLNDVSYMDYKTQTAHWGWEPTDTRLGGTEESVVRWGEELVKRGHEVTVYRNGRTDQEHGINDVVYRESSLYYGGGDICINIKNSEMKPKEPTLYLTNETDASKLDLSAYLGVILPSQWAVDNIPVNNKTFILPHGYDDKKIFPKEKVNKQVLYASSPDRGLDLLGQIWPSVVEQHPDAHLYVTYGGELNTPNTTCGEFSEEEMNELYNTSDIWCYPSTGGELYSISAKKAQASGCIPIVIPTMALSETVKTGFLCKDIREVYKYLMLVLSMQEDEKNEIRKDVVEGSNAVSWEKNTEQLLDIINSVII